MFTRDNLYANLQSGHRIKGRRLPDVPTDEGVRKVITLHLNAQLVRRQQQAERQQRQRRRTAPTTTALLAWFPPPFHTL